MLFGAREAMVYLHIFQKFTLKTESVKSSVRAILFMLGFVTLKQAL